MENPPTHLLLKWYVGYKYEIPVSEAKGKTGTIWDLVDMLGLGPIQAQTVQ